MSKFEQIMTAIVNCLTTATIPVLRNEDTPQEMNSRLLAILNDGSEIQSIRPLGGFQAVEHEHAAELILIVAPTNPEDRDAEFDDFLVLVVDALLVDETFGGLITGLDIKRPDTEMGGADGAAGYKSGTLDLRFYYQTNSLIS